ATAAKRGVREGQEAEMPETAAAGKDLLPLLDDELSRLPAKYRVLIILCDLEGKTRKEAAQQLGCTEGTVAGWLARARVRLAKRLNRHGLMVSGGELAAVLSQGTTSASAPATVVTSTIKATSLLATGQTVSGNLVSAQVITLMEGVVKARFAAKIKGMMAMGLLVVLALGGAVVGVRMLLGDF
ncbi:MAG TPA: sigma-70 family RNA polymerase sigma factor, partial [Gemmataceae bacterium]